jgi:predicted flavoprotein YhiN
MDAFDMVVIGSGPAGEKGAAQAAYFGKRVAMVDRAEDPGGRRFETQGSQRRRCERLPCTSLDFDAAKFTG